MRRLAIVLAVALAAGAVLAQAPSAEWRTVETKHFRVVYPAPYEAWALSAASKLDSVAAVVAKEVGYEPTETIDVIVADPLATANGAALPLFGAPRMILWTTPPPPQSVIGYYSDWTDLLLVHEDTHLAHLMRPSRNPLRRLESHVLPVGPIALDAPRWVTEGYATLVEGDLTGSGRPNGEARAAILRTWARAGRLPGYAALSSDRGSWMGMSMAYLVGSAYLEWLRERAGPDSLRHLWRRMTARQDRTFDQAFAGVFGDAPEALYSRFRAELTKQALDIEGKIEAHDGELWQDLAWTTGAPALSPDGKQIAIVLRSRKEPSRLVVWKTGKDEAAEKKYEERIRKMLEKDSEDVAPVRTRPLPRKPEFELTAKNGDDFFTPRWTKNGSILHVRYEPDRDGFLHPDLYLWSPKTGEVRRLTTGADVRDADPAPDGSWAVGVRDRFGESQLVKVDLASGQVSELTPPSIDEVVSTPRISPDGSRIAYLRHVRGRWSLAILEPGTRQPHDLALPDGTTIVSYPEWRDDRSILATIGRNGFLEIWDVDATDERAPWQITRSLGASIAPTTDRSAKSLFFLGMTVDGYVLRRMDLASAQALGKPAVSGALARPPARKPVTIESEELPPSKRYGAGRQEWLALTGGVVSPSARTFEAGVRLGDVIGRLDTVLVGSTSSAGGVDGVSLASVWRGWPVALGAVLYHFDESASDQPVSAPAIGSELDTTRSGLELTASRRLVWGRGGRLMIDGGALFGRVKRAEEDTTCDERIGFAHVWVSRIEDFGSWGYGYSFDGRVAKGETGDDSWTLYGGTVGADLEAAKTWLHVRWRKDRVDDASTAIDRLVVGGLEGSLIPEALQLARISSPALPVGILVGDESEMQGVSLSGPDFPLSPFWERYRVRTAGGPEGDWLALAGLRVRWRIGPVPLVRLPQVEIHAGVARILDAPLRDETEWWLGLRFAP